MGTFRINYIQVISGANSIKDLASDLKRQISSLESMEQEIKANWKGQAASELLNQTSAMIAEMNCTYRKMTNLSATIKNVANRIQKEDEAAAVRARALAQQNNK